MNVDLICAGQATYDLNLFLPEYPGENTKAEVHDAIEAGGGPAANAAWLASNWGCRVAFAGLAGDDGFGRRILEEFQQVGTDVTLLELRPGHATSYSVILVSGRTGSRTLVNHKARSASYVIPQNRLAGLAPKCLLFDGHELHASLQLLDAFPGAVSVLDAGSSRPGTLELAGRVNHLIASERFALQVTGEPDLAQEPAQLRAMDLLRSRYGARVAVTLGEQGWIADDLGEIRRGVAYPAQAVDTTGAGDVFHGAFAHGIVMGLSYWNNLERASMAAALSVEKRGARPSIPDLCEVEEALDRGR